MRTAPPDPVKQPGLVSARQQLISFLLGQLEVIRNVLGHFAQLVVFAVRRKLQKRQHHALKIRDCHLRFMVNCRSCYFVSSGCLLRRSNRVIKDCCNCASVVNLNSAFRQLCTPNRIKVVDVNVTVFRNALIFRL